MSVDGRAPQTEDLGTRAMLIRCRRAWNDHRVPEHQKDVLIGCRRVGSAIGPQRGL